MQVAFKAYRDVPHGPQDYQSLLMHIEAVRMIHGDASLVDKALGTLARWDAMVSPRSKPLRDAWLKIITSGDWDKAVEESARGNQLRQASPLGCLLPNEIRLEIIQRVRLLKELSCAQD